MGAVLNGCVIVSEHSTGFEPLTPGEHFVSVGRDRLPFAINTLLNDPGSVARIRHAAYEFVKREMPLAATVAPLVGAIEKVARERRERGHAEPAPTPPLPVKPASPRTEYQRIFNERTALDQVRAGLKEVVLGQVELRRTIGELTRPAATEGGFDAVEYRGDRERPVRASVLLTVYNYADVVANAIESVTNSHFADCELVVVD